MAINISSRYIASLRNKIDIRRAPFSFRGSRIVIMDFPGEAPDQEHSIGIKLAERLTTIEPGLGTHLLRPPFIGNLGPVDTDGISLDYEIETYPHAVFLHTRIGSFGITFHDLDTVCIGLPESGGGISFLVRPSILHSDDTGCEFRSVRDFAYTANCPLSLNRVSEATDGFEVTCVAREGSDPSITLAFSAQGESTARTAFSFAESSSSSENLWHRWFDSAPPVDGRWRDAYIYAWWVMGNNLVSPKGFVTYEAMMPSKSHYIGIWQWDAFFHALAFRHMDSVLAENQFRTLFACQQPDGMLPDAIWDEGVVTEIDHPVQGCVTKPPIAAWAAWKVYETTRNDGFLREMYGPLARLNNWWFGMNGDGSSGLAQYSHPYSSGLDDSPLWDYGMPVRSPELNTYLCLGALALAEMAAVLGRNQDASMWRAKAVSLVDCMTKELYDEKAGLFWATRKGLRIDVVTPFNFYPLLTGLLPQAIANRLVDRLRDPEMFWAKYPLPTVAMNDPHYDPLTMWRGPVWINVNAFFVDGLQRAGYADLAAGLRTRTLELVASQPGIYEYYHPQTGLPPEKTAFAFGWSAACFIDLALQDSRNR